MSRIPRLRRTPSPALVLSLVALMVAMSGTSVADPVRSAAAKLVGSKQIKKNAITSKHVKNGSLTAKDFKNGQLPQGKQGPAGPAGPRGLPGPAGPAGPSRPANQADRAPFAQVTADGDIELGRGVVSVKHEFAGQYEVKFNRTIREECAPLVGGFDADHLSSPAPGGISANDGRGFGIGAPSDTVSVNTRKSNGELADRGFVVQVLCP